MHNAPVTRSGVVKGSIDMTAPSAGASTKFPDRTEGFRALVTSPMIGCSDHRDDGTVATFHETACRSPTAGRVEG
jgi:hypothetical protein